MRKQLWLAALALTLGGPAAAEDASQDRINFDAAAGRVVFQNVLLADPQAFASRSSLGERSPSRTALAPPASSGEASRDRDALDVTAGRVAFRSTLGVDPQSTINTLATRRNSPSQPGSKSVRVVLASPYGQ